MAAARGVWAIDIGTSAIKALRLRDGEDGPEVVGFDYVEHSRILSSGEVDTIEKEQIVADTLRKFLSQNEIGKEEVAISIAGQNSFARFIKLPPVEPKKIPEIVQFEAIQQIPFDINEVEWDWQLMENPDSPDTEVGIFAIKNELIAEVMDHFTHENLHVTHVQIAPMALYNYAYYDRKGLEESPNKAVIIMDMGAENTTLVVCTRDSVWQRSIRVGGNTFTHAIADAFNLDFQKAEKLKRTAPVSKYMRQIYTAMKPVYTELGGEIQRSLGFYSSSAQGRDKTFISLIATGGGMKLQGLAKYIQQTIGITVIKPDSFERLRLSPEVSAAKFHENVTDFAVVYGLGVQLMGQAKIRTNLLPRKIARAMAWTRKARIFTIAAGVLVVVMLAGLVTAFWNLKQYDGYKTVRDEVNLVVNRVQGLKNQIAGEETRKQPLLDTFKKHKELFEFRTVVPMLNETILKCLPSAENTPDQAALYEALNNGDVAALIKTPRKERKQLFITRLMIEPAQDVSAAAFPKPDMSAGSGLGPRVGGAPVSMPMAGGMTMPPMMGMAPDSMGQTAENKTGFVVLIEGYSPYEKIAELLDPFGIGDNQSRWGIVTRFENLGKLFPSSPFELFKKGDITHFKVETGRVDPKDTAMPKGIGITKEIERVPKEQVQPTDGGRGGGMGMMMPGMGGAAVRITSETVLVDPMTQEEISKTYDIYTQEDINRSPNLTDRDLGRRRLTQFGEEQFIQRDHWFRIQVKFIWKDASKVPQPAGAGTGMTTGMGYMPF